jgi:hypothetical protein
MLHPFGRFPGGSPICSISRMTLWVHYAASLSMLIHLLCGNQSPGLSHSSAESSREKMSAHSLVRAPRSFVQEISTASGFVRVLPAKKHGFMNSGPARAGALPLARAAPR